LNYIVRYLSECKSWTKFLKYLRLGRSLKIPKGENIVFPVVTGTSKIESLKRFNYL